MPEPGRKERKMSVNDLRRKMVTSGLAGLAVAFLPGAHNSRSYAQGKQPQDLSRGDAMLEAECVNNFETLR
jgi:hypothetical protein